MSYTLISENISLEKSPQLIWDLIFDSTVDSHPLHWKEPVSYKLQNMGDFCGKGKMKSCLY